MSLEPARPRTRVLVVDDSWVSQSIMARGLDATGDMEVVGVASDALQARELLLSQRPEVVILDLDTPQVHGLTFLAKMMRFVPTPTVIVTDANGGTSEEAIAALTMGAVSVVPKATHGGQIAEFFAALTEAVRTAACCAPRRCPSRILPGIVEARPSASELVIGIGASTGGPRTLGTLLSALPKDSPPVVVVQHMPVGFTGPLAENLNRVAPLAVAEARDGQPLEAGSVYIAPAGVHLRVAAEGGGWVARLESGPRVQMQRPAVDVLFTSLAETVGDRAIGVLLTGMGRDGAEGLRSMRQAGARTIAQDESTCVVFGMPRAAIEIGAASHVLPIEEIGPAVAAWSRQSMGDLRAG